MGAMAALTIQQAFELALQHHQAGRLQRAEQMYRQILTQQPGHADAMHLLGFLGCQAGRREAGVKLIRQAIALRPNFPEAYNNLGIALSDEGMLDDAVAAYRQAVGLKPGFAAAHYNLGNALTSKGQFAEAAAAYRQALALKPDYPEAYSNLGNALRGNGELDEAIAAFRQAIAIRHNFPEAHYNLGRCLREKRQILEAIAAYREAIALQPNYAEAYSNLGNALRDKGEGEAAIAAYRRAIALQPKLAEAHLSLGTALRDKGQLDEAIAASREAIALRPDDAEAYNNLGTALKDDGRLGEALAAYRQAVALDPGNAWIDSNYVATLHYHPAYDAQAIASECRRWNVQHGAPLQRFIPHHDRARSPDRQLRIGYVSPDFRGHVVGRNLMPLFRNHDRRQFEITCYAQVPRPDALTGEFQQHADRWRDIVGMTDEQAARQIGADQIDILVDLALHTANNRLLVFARKPAPVQVTFAGYPGSTGLTTIDYRLSDPHLDPPQMDESVYSERTIRLPDSFWCYDPLESRDVPVSSLPARTNGWITFGCLNNFCKINEGVLRLWAKVMRAVESSRLLLLAPEGSVRAMTQGVLDLEGISAERIEFASFRPRQQYLELYQRIDVGLDSFPYNGHTTSLDSLWMGVPVVTLVGRTVVGRAGVCQLMNLNLPELIGQTPERYVEIAASLAGDPARLGDLRSTLRRRMEQSPLMDGPRFARNIEGAYREMWGKWCAGETGTGGA